VSHGQVAGIDYDSKGIFCAFIDLDAGRWLGESHYDLAAGPGDALVRCQRVRDLMPEQHKWADAEIVRIGLESTFSQGFQVTAALARVQGAIIACLGRDVPIELLTANGRARPGWKLLTVGTTNASKADVKRWALAHGAPAGLVQDHYDAFCIARATRRILRTTIEEDPNDE
jgi:hypothetical protein